MPQDKNPTTQSENSSAGVANSVNKRSPDATYSKVSKSKSTDNPKHVAQDATAPENDLPGERPDEHGGQAGLEPTRYGDWEKKGRCTDF